MAKTDFIPMLMLGDVADALGVARQNVSSIPDLPQPRQVIKRGPLWRADEVFAFAEVFRERTNRDPLTDEEQATITGLLSADEKWVAGRMARAA